MKNARSQPLQPERYTSFSSAARSLNESITHGTHANIALLNHGRKSADQVIDLSIGSLDIPVDPRIDAAMVKFIQQNPKQIHDFAPVVGFPFLLESLVARVNRIHGVQFDTTECMITPGGIKGALTVLFHTFLNSDDEVIIPVPNWPHYGDMVRLHRAKPVFLKPSGLLRDGAKPTDLARAITPKTKLVILGDCINPTGKVYSTAELTALAKVIARLNLMRLAKNQPTIDVIYDCPYESHILGKRPKLFSSITVKLEDGQTYSMNNCTAIVSGPGKVYGMHGDRIGYILANRSTITMAARVQVNTNSFAATYGQIATHIALQPRYDKVATTRAQSAHLVLETAVSQLNQLPKLKVVTPDGGYFLLVDFSGYSDYYRALGYDNACDFLLDKARVAGIDGRHFWSDQDDMRHWLRLNCGRSLDVLQEACVRIQAALSSK